MKIAVVGTGAIGVWLAGSLALAGHEVSGLARGATLDNLRQFGWRIRRDGITQHAPAKVSDRHQELGTQDAVLICVKNFSMPAVAEAIAGLCHQDTIIVPALNGVPWWFLQTLPASRAADFPQSEAAARLSHLLPDDRIVGCVINAGAWLPEPGFSSISFQNLITLGDARGGNAAQVEELRAALSSASLPVTLSDSIHVEIWKKLLLNMIFNSLSALTRSSPRQVLGQPDLRALIESAGEEAIAIARRLDLPFPDGIDATLDKVNGLGDFKPSTLQDVEEGRPLEIDALIGMPQQIGKHLGMPTPSIDILHGLIRLLDASLTAQRAVSQAKLSVQALGHFNTR